MLSLLSTLLIIWFMLSTLLISFIHFFEKELSWENEACWVIIGMWIWEVWLMGLDWLELWGNESEGLTNSIYISILCLRILEQSVCLKINHHILIYSKMTRSILSLISTTKILWLSPEKAVKKLREYNRSYKIKCLKPCSSG